MRSITSKKHGWELVVPDTDSSHGLHKTLHKKTRRRSTWQDSLKCYNSCFYYSLEPHNKDSCAKSNSHSNTVTQTEWRFFEICAELPLKGQPHQSNTTCYISSHFHRPPTSRR
eukprot:92994-Amphidinium_carterae.1